MCPVPRVICDGVPTPPDRLVCPPILGFPGIGIGQRKQVNGAVHLGTNAISATVSPKVPLDQSLSERSNLFVTAGTAYGVTGQDQLHRL